MSIFRLNFSQNKGFPDLTSRLHRRMQDLIIMNTFIRHNDKTDSKKRHY